eukprot:12912215-Prorocentrum_lima.AAC.1
MGQPRKIGRLAWMFGGCAGVGLTALHLFSQIACLGVQGESRKEYLSRMRASWKALSCGRQA